MAVRVCAAVPLFLFFSVICQLYALAPHKRFEYKLSFKGPHLVQKDGTIPFWEHGGHAIASDESIRVTPSLRSKRGWVWAKNKNTNPNWEVTVTFRVSGRGRIGADGLAVWFTEEKGTEGPVFGNIDKWKGLGVIFDSFDNDGQHNNPYIMAMVNDGTKEYDHHSDGSHQQLGGCLRDFRNKPFPVRAKIEYYNKALTIMFHNGMSNNNEDYELCLRAENVELPKEGYFGISAATGGLADDHDVHSFLTHSLKPMDDVKPGTGQVTDDEKKKFEKEFDDYWQKLQKAKDEYQKEHPNKQDPYDPENEDKWYESQNQRELKQIFDGQTTMHRTISALSAKLDEVIGRQERTLSQITNMGQQVGQPNGQGQQQGGGAMYVDTIKRHEVDTVLGNQREMVQTIRDLKTVSNDLHAKTNHMYQNQGAAQGGGGAAALEAQALNNEIRNSLNDLKQNIQQLVNRPQGGAACPPPPAVNCVSPFYFLVIAALQIVIFIGYMAFKNSKDAAAKKFY